MLLVFSIFSGILNFLSGRPNNFLFTFLVWSTADRWRVGEDFIQAKACSLISPAVGSLVAYN